MKRKPLIATQLAASATTLLLLAVSARSASATERPTQLQKTEHRVVFSSDDDGLQIQEKVGESYFAGVGFVKSGVARVYGKSNSYQPVCGTAPCASDLPSGYHEIAVAKDGSVPISAGAINVTGPSNVNVIYTSHSEKRTVGWVLMGGGIAAAIGSYFLSSGSETTCSSFGSQTSCLETHKTNLPVLLGGIGVGLGLGIAGFVLAITRDEARLEVTPVVGTQTQGAALRGRF